MSYFPIGHIPAGQGVGNGTWIPAVGAEEPKICADACRGSFLQKSLVLVADYEQLCRESARIARGEDAILKIGFLRSYSSPEFQQALEEFSVRYPDISVRVLYGNHEELFTLLRTGGADLVLNDQRRAFSDEYVNLVLTTSPLYIELSARNPVAALPSVTTQELKNIPCILVTSQGQRDNEKEFYQTVIGIQGEILFAENLEEARMMVLSGQGFLPVEGNGRIAPFVESIRRVPLCRGEKPVTRNYCLFWKKENAGCYVETFSDMTSVSRSGVMTTCRFCRRSGSTSSPPRRKANFPCCAP